MNALPAITQTESAANSISTRMRTKVRTSAWLSIVTSGQRRTSRTTDEIAEAN